ncbi:MAG: hypothetical protein SFW35_02550 [Chitinophagales bacterium]|nr:hypothetical protein [Chitinophagales bacterium]
MNDRLFLFLAFGCIGITTEIFFTASMDAKNALLAGQSINWRLMGQSYIWMLPIYGLAGLLLPIVYKRLQHLHVIIRMCLYALSIFTVEFITGWLLDMITGSCPWEYKTGLQVMGYIRLDYFPAWALFGFMIERIYILLSSKLHLKV